MKKLHRKMLMKITSCFCGFHFTVNSLITENFNISKINNYWLIYRKGLRKYLYIYIVQPFLCLFPLIIFILWLDIDCLLTKNLYISLNLRSNTSLSTTIQFPTEKSYRRILFVLNQNDKIINRVSRNIFTIYLSSANH